MKCLALCKLRVPGMKGLDSHALGTAVKISQVSPGAHPGERGRNQSNKITVVNLLDIQAWKWPEYLLVNMDGPANK